ncbi:hypothetical protein CC85DRAFT_309129 [Cutaneotrichosporon oleaginosum]|uniref:Nitrogen regulatory protein areA GATA-like domain-containing protein n=1 Tax=Cutaneotrichosporon oleaginosum TaxID=879819 RepID=A0A0J0XG86_9TREE|nr:uncharacterized protein CC85DRAFT_309129 [Cutaneotrichosporon oleaginosum]KLT40100.1 hypothetical protein CC85DRAFT_309129 [Cutaneotrichosporon oleaginosum]TXT04739.1 hypothetical protein COLE_07558 [Cutaneotrichosporon oleaginosum]
MAQIIPSITSLPSDSGAAPSVEDIQDRLPSICVDYLSHNWTEEDVWASWRNMTRHKHEIANGVRLENASWRTWNKQRNKLRTISPETLNWLKDSDVTWLYGPLHTAKVEPVRPLRISSTEDRVGIDLPNNHGKPGILKHRTLSELLSLPGPTSPDLDDSDAIDEDEPTVPTRIGLIHTKSESNLHRSNSMPARRRGGALGRTGSVRAGSSINNRSKEASPENNNRRKITFNTFVEQCIALDEPNLSQPPFIVIGQPSSMGLGHQQSSAMMDEDLKDDDAIKMRPSNSRYSSGRRSSSISSTQSHSSMTIKKIAPTVLKTAGSYANNPSVPQTVHRPPVEYMPQEEDIAPVIAPSSFGAQSPLGQVGSRPWHSAFDDDHYDSSGSDYFGGPPDLLGSSPRTGSYGRAPAVQTPPAQPRWRQAQTVDVPPSSVSTSSSSSSLNAAIPIGASSPQPPSRGILKVRAAPVTSQQAPEPVSPPAHFNYNPSVATGIGGMYGTYENAQLAIGSPAAPTTTTTTSEDGGRRGRSTSRGQGGSSQWDRYPVPRGSSTSSASSVGSVSRSPVDAGNSKTTAPRSQQVDKVQHEPMDVDASPDRSSTPTPHSSPQIVFRPLKDTSPASLPHTSTRPTGLGPEPVGGAGVGVVAGPSGERPNLVDSPASASPQATLGDARGELSQPSDGVDEDDGSTLIGRATNIANTAKDLLGALWYGSQDEAARPRPPARQHRRGASLG